MKKRLIHLGCDRGDTLVEVLVTIVIMGIAMIAIVGGFATSIFMSTLHRQQASEQTLLRAYADAVEANQTWTACSATTPATYNPGTGAGSIGWVVPASYGTGYTASATSVKYGPTFSSSPCSPDTSDTGVRKVTVQVQSSRATESMDVVIRCLGLRKPTGPCP